MRADTWLKSKILPFATPTKADCKGLSAGGGYQRLWPFYWHLPCCQQPWNQRFGRRINDQSSSSVPWNSRGIQFEWSKSVRFLRRKRRKSTASSAHSASDNGLWKFNHFRRKSTTSDSWNTASTAWTNAALFRRHNGSGSAPSSCSAGSRATNSIGIIWFPSQASAAARASAKRLLCQNYICQENIDQSISGEKFVCTCECYVTFEFANFLAGWRTDHKYSDQYSLRQHSLSAKAQHFIGGRRGYQGRSLRASLSSLKIIMYSLLEIQSRTDIFAKYFMKYKNNINYYLYKIFETIFAHVVRPLNNIFLFVSFEKALEFWFCVLELIFEMEEDFFFQRFLGTLLSKIVKASNFDICLWAEAFTFGFYRSSFWESIAQRRRK